jgi:hypothetical protein
VGLGCPKAIILNANRDVSDATSSDESHHAYVDALWHVIDGDSASLPPIEAHQEEWKKNETAKNECPIEATVVNRAHFDARDRYFGISDFMNRLIRHAIDSGLESWSGAREVKVVRSVEIVGEIHYLVIGWIHAW